MGVTAVGVWDRVAESWQGLVGVFLFSRYGVCQRQARGDSRRWQGRGQSPGHLYEDKETEGLLTK